MRRVTAIALSAAALAAGVLTGCGPWDRPDEADDGLVLKPMRPGAGEDAPRMYQIQIVRVRHRLRPDAPLEDTWRLLGTTGVPHQKRALWRANDLRLAEGGQLAAERLQALVRETPDRTVRFSRLVIPENHDFVIESGTARPEMTVVWTDAAGRLAGRRFGQATPRFRLVCRRAADDPRAVAIAVVPEVAYGRERVHFRRTDRGYARRTGRDQFTPMDLSAEIRLDPGRMLVLGGRRSSEVSLGATLFFQRRGPDLWEQTLLISARALTPAAAAEADTSRTVDPAVPPPGPPDTGTEPQP